VTQQKKYCAAMNSMHDLQKKLAEHCQERGFMSKIAEKMGVAKSTVSRWADGAYIPESRRKMLELCLNETMHQKTMLTFTYSEWQIVSIMARRAGRSEKSWIVNQIRRIIQAHP
jgi:hypothetical protein